MLSGKMECGPSKSKDCSLGEFLKTVFDAVALSVSSECSGETSNEAQGPRLKEVMEARLELIAMEVRPGLIAMMETW